MKIFSLLTILTLLLLTSCNISEGTPELNGTVLASPMPPGTVTLRSPSPTVISSATLVPTPALPNTPTTIPTPTATATAIPIEPAATGADIRIDSWSPDGIWLGYWLSTKEDLTAGSYPASIGRLYFLNPHTGQVCEHPNLVSSEYPPLITWQPDGRAVVHNKDTYQTGSPCEDFTPLPVSDIVFPKVQDPSLSPEGSYRVRSDVRDETEFLVVTTTITNVSNGEVENSVEWEIEQALGELGLGGEWVTDDLFILYGTRERGPLLLEAGKGVIQVAPDLFGVPGNLNLNVRAAAVKDTEIYHILIYGTGSEANLPPVRLYHSETGVVEELPYTHLWRYGFSPDGHWVLLDSRPNQEGYESYALWVRPVDPPESRLRLLAEGTPWFSWSSDQSKIAFGWTGRFSVLAFPEGDEIGSWSTDGYTNYYIVWSPKGDFIATAGNINGQMDAALYIVPIRSMDPP
jgi:hypothetical protein